MQPDSSGETPKHAGGRPTLYRDEIIDELIEYFSQPMCRELKMLDKDGNETVKLMANPFPTLARFASNIGITRETLHDWATAKDDEGNLIRPQFSYAYKRAKDLQEANLVEGAIAGLHHPSFSIFTAKNVLGWKDKTEQEITGAGGGAIEFKVNVNFHAPKSN